MCVADHIHICFGKDRRSKHGYPVASEQRAFTIFGGLLGNHWRNPVRRWRKGMCIQWLKLVAQPACAPYLLLDADVVAFIQTLAGNEPTDEAKAAVGAQLQAYMELGFDMRDRAVGGHKRGRGEMDGDASGDADDSVGEDHPEDGALHAQEAGDAESWDGPGLGGAGGSQ